MLNMTKLRRYFKAYAVDMLGPGGSGPSADDEDYIAAGAVCSDPEDPSKDPPGGDKDKEGGEDDPPLIFIPGFGPGVLD